MIVPSSYSMIVVIKSSLCSYDVGLVGGRAFPQVSISCCLISICDMAKRKLRGYALPVLLVPLVLWLPELALCLDEFVFTGFRGRCFDCETSDMIPG